MEILISRQLIAMAASLGVGILSGLAYSMLIGACILVIPKMNFSKDGGAAAEKLPGKILLFFLDVLLSVAVGLAFSIASFAFSYGKVRLVNIISFVLGLTLYKRVPGKYIEYLICNIAHFCRSLLLRALLLAILLIRGCLKAMFKLLLAVYTLTLGKLVTKAKLKKEKRKLDRAIASLDEAVRFDCKNFLQE